MTTPIEAAYSSKVPVDKALCLPSQAWVNLRSEYTVPDGTTQMVFNPANIPDIAQALEGKADANGRVTDETKISA